MISLAYIVDRAGQACGDLDVRVGPADWTDITGLSLCWHVHPDAFFETRIAGRQVHFFLDPELEDGQFEVLDGRRSCDAPVHSI